MGYCLSHASAAAFWCWSSRIEGAALSRQREERAEANQWTQQTVIPGDAACALLASPRQTTCAELQPAIHAATLRSFARLHTLPSPLHILVSDQAFRQKKGVTCCHALTCAPASDEFFRVSDETAAISPELCLLQLGREYDLVDWLLLATEFCGAYTLDAQAPFGYLPRQPLTSTAALQTLIDQMDGLKGIKNIRQAMRWLADGAGSPREAGLALTLSLPRRLGGFGLPLPQFNHAIELGASAQALLGTRTCNCNLYFEDERVSVEYESASAPRDSSAASEMRYSALSLEGVRVVVVRPSDIATYEGLQETAKRIASELGRRFTRPADEEASRALAARLLGKHTHPWE